MFNSFTFISSLSNMDLIKMKRDLGFVEWSQTSWTIINLCTLLTCSAFWIISSRALFHTFSIQHKVVSSIIPAWTYVFAKKVTNLNKLIPITIFFYKCRSFYFRKYEQDHNVIFLKVDFQSLIKRVLLFYYNA